MVEVGACERRDCRKNANDGCKILRKFNSQGPILRGLMEGNVIPLDRTILFHLGGGGIRAPKKASEALVDCDTVVALSTVLAPE